MKFDICIVGSGAGASPVAYSLAKAGANVLVATFSERESHAVYFLQNQDMTRYDAVNYISHGIAKVPGVESVGNKTPKGMNEEAQEEAAIPTGI